MTVAPANRSMSGPEWALLIFLGLVWGGSFFFNGVAVRELPPATFVALRVALAAAVVSGLLAARRLPWPGREGWAVAFGMGMLNAALPFCLIVWAQTRIESGTASILNATTPLFTALAAHLLLRDERLTPGRVAGLAAGLAGVAVLIGPDAIRGLGGDVLAQAAVVAAAVSYAFAAVLGRSYARLGVAPMAAAAGQLICAAAVLAPVALMVDRPWTLAPPSAATWGAVLGIALLSTALAYVLLFRLLATAGATNTSLVTLVVPVSAVLLGVLFLGERLHPEQAVGMALIAGGLLVSDGRLGSLLGRRRELGGSSA